MRRAAKPDDAMLPDATGGPGAGPAHRLRIRHFLRVAGPGLIAMVGDNDAGAVSTYTQTGAQYGVSLLWVLVLLLPVIYLVQEMVARLGIATGRGHAALIYERFGRWWGRFALADLLIVNFCTLVTEFAAVALVARDVGIPPLAAVPLAAAGLILLVATGSYRRWERITLALCALNIGWLVLGWRLAPTLGAVARGSFLPMAPPGGLSSAFLFMAVALVGTTIAPWQLFFQQSCVADKRLVIRDLRWARLDTFLGAVAVVTTAAGMMIVGDALRRLGLTYEDPAQMAGALVPEIGRAGRALILLLMIDAALVGATAISLSSAWAWAEVMGRPTTLDARLAQAPHFYAIYALSVAAAGAVVLIPDVPLQTIIVAVQVLAGVMLPPAIIFVQLLIEDSALLGQQLMNRRWNNWLNWAIIAALFGLSLVLAIQALRGG